jgi:uncharacterized protein YjbI with pentapeptide repeats
LELDLKALFKALSKAAGHTAVGKWEELGTDTVEALSAIGLSTEPAELAFLLVRRSLAQALFDLVAESAAPHLTPMPPADVAKQLDFSGLIGEVDLDRRFLEAPATLPIISAAQTVFRQWLEAHGIQPPSAVAIADRLPTYFVYALNHEWRRNAKSYVALLAAINTPFTNAGEREWTWSMYGALLQRRVQESVFDEPFSLQQIYVPLRAFYFEEYQSKPPVAAGPRTRLRRVIVDLASELQTWIDKPSQQDTLRVISGGPGSGKSSFARVFAARLSENARIHALFVPLHLVDATRDVVDEIGRFVRDEGVLKHNPLDADSEEPNLVIIFDGLDELASQGKAAAETAGAFVREIDKLVERRNANGVRLRVLVSGRELVVQENESEFRKPRQILTLLPYFADQSSDRQYLRSDEEVSDPQSLLTTDLRDLWWVKYGELTGNVQKGLPPELARHELDEITAQPLLNYLVALSYTRKKIDFTKDVNLNEVYADLVSAVHERGYERKRPYGPIRHLSLEDFVRVLEEIGLAAWHGDGRTTTVREIEEHCTASGVGPLLEKFQDGAKAGVTRLLAAFFFRQYGRRQSGDPTFVFTHKSFGEYLASRRVVRAAEKIARDLQRRLESPDEGWSDTQALQHWAEITGPSAVSPYLFEFILKELVLRGKVAVTILQTVLVRLFSFIMKSGMPMERLNLPSFRVASFQARNSEEALLVIMNACARVTERRSDIEHPEATTFGTWLRRIQGQRSGGESVMAARCLSYLNLASVRLDMSDLYNANLESSLLSNAALYFVCLDNASLRSADLSGATLDWASVRGTDFSDADMRGVHMHDTNASRARFERSDLSHARLMQTILTGSVVLATALDGAVIKWTNTEDATLDASAEAAFRPVEP